MIRRDGSITDAYLDFGDEMGDEGPEGNVGHHGGAAAALAAEQGDDWAARTSHDGGATWSSAVLITDDAGEGPSGVRCCLPSATVDPITGRLFTAWDSATPDQVKLSQSFDGRHWSRPVVVASGEPGIDRVNVDVTAWRGQVFVSYGTRDTTVENGRFVQQQVSMSRDGKHFSAPVSLGPLSDLNFAAEARGKFPGDYAGSSAVRGRLYVVWCLSSTPPDPTAQFHQTLWAAAIRP